MNLQPMYGNNGGMHINREQADAARYANREQEEARSGFIGRLDGEPAKDYMNGVLDSFRQFKTSRTGVELALADQGFMDPCDGYSVETVASMLDRAEAERFSKIEKKVMRNYEA